MRRVHFHGSFSTEGSRSVVRHSKTQYPRRGGGFKTGPRARAKTASLPRVASCRSQKNSRASPRSRRKTSRIKNRHPFTKRVVHGGPISRGERSGHKVTASLTCVHSKMFVHMLCIETCNPPRPDHSLLKRMRRTHF
jgi:hypothetical protein